MPEYTKELATDIVFPHILVYRQYSDGVHYGYEVLTESGHVMCNPNANDTEFDSETMQEIPVTYYYVSKHLPLNFNFDNFPWVAVPRDSVDENYIFGGGDSDHETM